MTDSEAISDTSYVDVEVQDHSPPTLEVEPLKIVYDCQSRPIQLVPRRVEDTCDVDPPTDLTIVSVNGIAGNVPYTPTFKFPFGETTVKYRAVDQAGNEAVAYQTVVLERGTSCCPSGSLIVQGTNGNDTAMNASTTQNSCLVGFDGADHLYGKLKFDTQLAGRGNDILEDLGSPTSGEFMWGGAGNDNLRSVSAFPFISGGPGDDVVLYSGSSTVKIRGGAGKDTLTSTTSAQTTFVVGSPCEVVPGETWTAMNGPVRIESPISLSQIAARGAVLHLSSSVTYVPTGTLPDWECW